MQALCLRVCAFADEYQPGTLCYHWDWCILRQLCCYYPDGYYWNSQQKTEATMLQIAGSGKFNNTWWHATKYMRELQPLGTVVAPSDRTPPMGV